MLVYHPIELYEGLLSARRGRVISLHEKELERLRKEFNENPWKFGNDCKKLSLEDIAYQRIKKRYPYKDNFEICSLPITLDKFTALKQCCKWEKYLGGLVLAFYMPPEKINERKVNSLDLGYLREVFISPRAEEFFQKIKEDFDKYTPRYILMTKKRR